MEQSMNVGNKNATGFTLIELLITVAVAVVLATIAVPGFQNMVKTNRLVADYNEILATLNYARSEAVKRRVDVSAVVDSSGPWKISVDASDAVGTLRVSEGRDARVSISGPSSVVFNSLGRRSSCGGEIPCQLEVAIAGEDSKTIEISSSGSIN
ncbi:GspH/FimT family pseudopilin [Halomonas shengliensis]|uniref:GspH/FimT family pseudopilin n=1 Tax=Halomonas shengliensis TaxID=419597 RepID=UPI000ADC156F|nr:GspH/FimT family pseudopilin [Halomonas shengliensis]